MKKLIFQEWISLDGYAADANNSTSFFESPELNSGSDEDLLKDMDNLDTILLGANTYRMFVDFWPTAKVEDQVVADKLNAIPKVVFSSSLDAAPWGKWPAARIVSTDAATEVRKWKEEKGKNMVLWGSISLAQSLIKADLIDEYEIRICPVVLGAGKPLFKAGEEFSFDLVGSKQYPSGLMLLKFKRK